MNHFQNDPNGKYRAAVISDTHGLLRASVLKKLDGVDLIIHAGDVGDYTVLNQLGEIAPVYAVRGNTDYNEVVVDLPLFDCFKVADMLIYVIHDLHTLDLDIKATDIDIVISGHTHQPHSVEHSSVLFLNPGSIGPRRFDYPISMVFLEIEQKSCTTQFVEFQE